MINMYNAVCYDGVDAYVIKAIGRNEDDIKNISELSTMIPVICYDSEYNRMCKGNNIIRCYSWYDIYIKINQQ